MMKNMFTKVIILMVMLGAFFTSCLKKDSKCGSANIEITATSSEKDALKAYLQSASIPFNEDSHGFFYKIVTPGSGAIIANLCSTVSVNYVGKLQSGTTFDQSSSGTPASFTLGSLIYGWQKGLPYIAKGGRILLYIPPSLGYGPNPVKDPTTGATVIPANSNLFFDITLVDVQ